MTKINHVTKTDPGEITRVEVPKPAEGAEIGGLSRPIYLDGPIVEAMYGFIPGRAYIEGPAAIVGKLKLPAGTSIDGERVRLVGDLILAERRAAVEEFARVLKDPKNWVDEESPYIKLDVIDAALKELNP